MNIKEVNLVTFKQGLYDDEIDTVYQVVEINGDRCFLELVNTNMVLRPQSVALLSDLDFFVETVRTNALS